MPTRIGGGRMLAVWLALRDSGALTPNEVAAKLGYQGRQVAPLLWALAQMGAARMVGDRFINARLAQWA